MCRFFAPGEVEPTTYCAATLSWIKRVCLHARFNNVKLVSGTWQIPVSVSRFRQAGFGILSFPSALGVRILWNLRSGGSLIPPLLRITKAERRLGYFKKWGMFRGLFHVIKE